MEAINSSFVYSKGIINDIKLKQVMRLCIFVSLCPICHLLLFCVLPHSSSETHTFAFCSLRKDHWNINKILTVEMEVAKWWVGIQIIANGVNFLLVVNFKCVLWSKDVVGKESFKICGTRSSSSLLCYKILWF